MSIIKAEDIEHIAKLSRLQLTHEEVQKFSQQLTSILSYVGQLNECDTTDVAPTRQVTGSILQGRKDRRLPASAETRDAILRQAPESEGDGLKVPTVLQE